MRLTYSLGQYSYSVIHRYRICTAFATLRLPDLCRVVHLTYIHACIQICRFLNIHICTAARNFRLPTYAPSSRDVTSRFLSLFYPMTILCPAQLWNGRQSGNTYRCSAFSFTNIPICTTARSRRTLRYSGQTCILDSEVKAAAATLYRSYSRLRLPQPVPRISFEVRGAPSL
jgi:hypothetical protein